MEEPKPETVKPVFDPKEIEKQIPKAFRGVIKPFLEPIGNWVESVEARFKILSEEMPKQIVDQLQARARQAQQQQIQAMQTAGNPTTANGGINLGTIGQFAQLIPYFMGGGQNSELNKLAMQALTANIGMAQAITNAVVSKITGKATTEVAQELTS